MDGAHSRKWLHLPSSFWMVMRQYVSVDARPLETNDWIWPVHSLGGHQSPYNTIPPSCNTQACISDNIIIPVVRPCWHRSRASAYVDATTMITTLEWWRWWWWRWRWIITTNACGVGLFAAATAGARYCTAAAITYLWFDWWCVNTSNYKHTALYCMKKAMYGVCMTGGHSWWPLLIDGHMVDIHMYMVMVWCNDTYMGGQHASYKHSICFPSSRSLMRHYHWWLWKKRKKKNNENKHVVS